MPPKSEYPDRPNISGGLANPPANSKSADSCADFSRKLGPGRPPRLAPRFWPKPLAQQPTAMSKNASPRSSIHSPLRTVTEFPTFRIAQIFWGHRKSAGRPEIGQVVSRSPPKHRPRQASLDPDILDPVFGRKLAQNGRRRRGKTRRRGVVDPHPCELPPKFEYPDRPDFSAEIANPPANSKSAD